MAKIETFFSCSFASDDVDVNDVFRALTEGLGFDLTNVSEAAPITPPQVARDKIDNAQCLIAICTRRDELKSGKFHMPQAVHDEISFAFGADTPVLMFVEEGVELAGFKGNFGTYQYFTRTNLTSPEILQKIVRSLADIRAKLLGENDVVYQGLSDSFAEEIHHLVELKVADDDFIWEYSTRKKLVFTCESKRSFSSGVWSTVPAASPETASNVTWSYEVLSSSRDLGLVAEIEKHTPACVEVMLRPHPHAKEGDFIEYATLSRGRYINPIWDDETLGSSLVHLDDCDKKCGDGLIFVHNTKRAIMEFRFCAEYALSAKELVPFVGRYTNSVDYEVPSEIERAKVRIDEFGRSVTVRIEIDSPLIGHIYGVAWNPRTRAPAIEAPA